jgi:hypothetical protein
MATIAIQAAMMKNIKVFAVILSRRATIITFLETDCLCACAHGTPIDQKTSERCTARPAVTPSALAHVTLWEDRVMSPAA